MDQGITDAHLVSSRPAVLALAAGDDLVTGLISLDEHGRTLARIKLDPEHQTLACDQAFSAVVEGCRTVVVGDSRAFLATDHGIDALLLFGAEADDLAGMGDPAEDDVFCEHGGCSTRRRDCADRPPRATRAAPPTSPPTSGRRPPEARRRPPIAAGAPVQGHRATLVPWLTAVRVRTPGALCEGSGGRAQRIPPPE
ncbi:hypothetical protein ACWC2T_15780 [Streptomyces sp. NPDC001393]